MKLVQFTDGSYGVKRSFLFGGCYLDFDVLRRRATRVWWDKCDIGQFDDCKTTKEEALSFLCCTNTIGEKSISWKKVREMYREMKGITK